MEGLGDGVVFRVLVIERRGPVGLVQAIGGEKGVQRRYMYGDSEAADSGEQW